MKTIALMPIKNEDWILPISLHNLSKICDHIIIADQQSTDKSLEICRQFKNISIIENHNSHHDNSVRWLLLDEARKKFGYNNLILCIDADELISIHAINKIKEQTITSSCSFTFPWIQLWGDVRTYRNDGIWKDATKECIFFDDGTVDYDRHLVINDHTARVPTCVHNIYDATHPLLHLQYVFLEQAQIKQVWYKCHELLSGKNARKINHRYAHTLDADITTQTTPSTWFHDISMLDIKYNSNNDWRYKEICDLFKIHGVIFFEPLEIWHIKSLRDIFEHTTGRIPRSKKFPTWLIKLYTWYKR